MYSLQDSTVWQNIYSLVIWLDRLQYTPWSLSTREKQNSFVLWWNDNLSFSIQICLYVIACPRSAFCHRPGHQLQLWLVDFHLERIECSWRTGCGPSVTGETGVGRREKEKKTHYLNSKLNKVECTKIFWKYFLKFLKIVLFKVGYITLTLCT